MNALNSILLEGNLVRDPKLKTTPGGTKVVSFSIASNRFFRDGGNLVGETSYFDVEAWGRLAEACSETLTKGRGVRVVGRLKQDRWTDADGKMRSRVKIVAEHVEFKPTATKPQSSAQAEESNSEPATVVTPAPETAEVSE